MKSNNTYARYIRTKDIIFKHAKGMRDIFGLEFHPYHEIFLFLEGDAEFISGTFRKVLEKNSLVIIPKESFHHFVVHGPEEEYHRCVLNFGTSGELGRLIEEKMQDVCILHADAEMCALFKKLCTHTADSNVYKKELLLKAVFTEILLEADTSRKHQNEEENMPINPIIKDAVKFINKNAGSISHIRDVAAVVNVSESYLSHLFSKELHISPHKYILEKKLIMANRMIESGYGAVAASEECGFGNYSGFYKMYKKMFGYPPSKARRSDI